MQEMHAVLPSVVEGVSRAACEGGGVMARKGNRQAGFRVDLKLAESSGGAWIPYTSRNALIDLDFAVSLFQGLQRQGAAARVVEMPGEQIIQECEESKCK